MAIIIQFPRPHKEYTYLLEECSCCHKTLQENEKTHENLDEIRKTVECICNKCFHDQLFK